MNNQQERKPGIESPTIAELLQKRFSQGSINELGQILDKFVGEVQQHDPNITTYQLFQKLAEKMPYQIPQETSDKTLQAIRSTDANTRRVGNKVALMLHARTILSATSHLLDEPLENDVEKDDLFHAAVLSATKQLSETRSGADLSRSIYYASRRGAAIYIASRLGLPASLVDNPLFKPVKNKIISKLEDKNNRLSDLEIDELVNDLHRKTNFSKEDILSIFSSLRFWTSRTQQDIDEVYIEPGEDERVFNEVASNLLGEDVEDVLFSLNLRERLVLTDYFFNEAHAVKTAKELGITPEGTRQIRKRTLIKLRSYPYRDRARNLIEYLNPKDESLISPTQLSHRRLRLSPDGLKDTTHALFNPTLLSVRRLEIDVESYPLLKKCGIRLIGDFFTIPFKDIQARWRGRSDELIEIFTKVRNRLSSLYNECRVFELPSEPNLFLHVTNSVLFGYDLDYVISHFVHSYYTEDGFLERDKIREVYNRLNQRPTDEKTIPTQGDILILGQDPIERSARRRIFKRALEHFNFALERVKQQKRTPYGS